MIKDEPLNINVVNGNPKGGFDLKEEISKLCDSQLFAVLSTQGEEGPYTSLISFAITPDLKNIVFATPQKTRKLELIIKNKMVSIMIDNRDEKKESINDLRAITVTGCAKLNDKESKNKEWENLLVEKHPYLKSFLDSANTIIVTVEVEEYFFVKDFQNTFRWTPKYR